MAEAARDETHTILDLLRECFSADSCAVERLAGGAFSRAYGFRSGGTEYVVRVNNEAHAPGSFANDDYAARHFASASLPIPRLLGSGVTPDGQGWYAISERAPGRTLAESTPAECRAAMPALLDTVEAIARVDISGTSGSGPWDGTGNGEFVGWRAYLRAIMDNDAEGYYADWHALFERSFLKREVYERVYEHMLGLLPGCPEERALIHNDLWLDASNLLVQDGRVAGVIDWSNGLYGDPLYDVARILWGTNWPGWWDDEDVVRVRGRFGREPDFGVRMACYTCHIGLDDLRYYARNGRWADYEIAEGLLLSLVGGE